MIVAARHALFCLLVSVLCSTCSQVYAEGETSKKAAELVEIAEGQLVFDAPGEWDKVTPRNRIIELEFAVKPREEASVPARMTVMASGGTIQQNMLRWVGQFNSPKAPEGAEVGKAESLEVDGMKAHLVDLSGDYFDSPRGPFGPKVERKGYRMLAAIVETKASGNYFFKLIGPEDLVASNAEAFRRMVKSVRHK